MFIFRTDRRCGLSTITEAYALVSLYKKIFLPKNTVDKLETLNILYGDMHITESGENTK